MNGNGLILKFNHLVYSKSELEKAKNNRYETIIVTGDLAKKLYKAQKVTKLSKAALTTLTIALGAAAVAAPVTGGLSFAVAAPIAIATGTNIAVIIAISAIGLGLILAIFKEYETISFDGRNLKLELKKSK